MHYLYLGTCGAREVKIQRLKPEEFKAPKRHGWKPMPRYEPALLPESFNPLQARLRRQEGSRAGLSGAKKLKLIAATRQTKTQDPIRLRSGQALRLRYPALKKTR